MMIFTKTAVSLLPVIIFLCTLVIIDSYKLVRFKVIARNIVLGCLAAIAAYFLNNILIDITALNSLKYSKFVAPIVEEILKAVSILYLIKTKKVGFMVDSAICGFAIGTGFALVENIYYLNHVESSNILLWSIRGFGTAIMHGGTAAIFGLISKYMLDYTSPGKIKAYLPGLFCAILLHSIFNQFILPPLLMTILLLIVLPLIITVVFQFSEKATRDWLGIGFDTDMELLELIKCGQISKTKVGEYLETLRGKYPGEILADMLCFLRINIELALRAKGYLMMKEKGFKVTIDDDIQAKFRELRYLEKSIGKSGRLTIQPLVHTKSQDLWQFYLIER